MHKSSIISRLAVLALGACCTVASVASCALNGGRMAWRRTAAWFVNHFDWLVSKIKPAQAQHLTAPKRALLDAVQLLGRIVRRDRPIVSPRWRMCPST